MCLDEFAETGVLPKCMPMTAKGEVILADMHHLSSVDVTCLHHLTFVGRPRYLVLDLGRTAGLLYCWPTMLSCMKILWWNLRLEYHDQLCGSDNVAPGSKTANPQKAWFHLATPSAMFQCWKDQPLEISRQKRCCLQSLRVEPTIIRTFSIELLWYPCWACKEVSCHPICFRLGHEVISKACVSLVCYFGIGRNYKVASQLLLSFSDQRKSAPLHLSVQYQFNII